jgi:uncharacterized phage-associated protein
MKKLVKFLLSRLNALIGKWDVDMSNENTKGFEPETIANYFIGTGIAEGNPVTHMKLQKLIFIAHGLCLALLDRPLVNEQPEAWAYGPVIKSLYRKLKNNGNNSIETSLNDGINLDNFLEIKNILAGVWNAYKNVSAIELSAITHVSGSPWSQTRRDYPISNDMIKSYYEQLANNKA